MKVQNGIITSTNKNIQTLIIIGEVSKTMKILITVIVVAYVQMVSAEENMLLGSWSGNDRASEAIYGIMPINKKEISWGGSNPYNPYCRTTYTLVSKQSAMTYPGNMFPLINGRTFTIYKLKLDPQDCTVHDGYFQFALPSDTNRYAEVVTYGRDDRQTGWHNFSKVSDQPKVNQ